MLTLERGSPRLRLWHVCALVALAFLAIVAWNPSNQDSSGTIRGPDWALPLNLTTAVEETSAVIEEQTLSPALNWTYSQTADLEGSFRTGDVAAIVTNPVLLFYSVLLVALFVFGDSEARSRLAGFVRHTLRSRGQNGGAAIRHSLIPTNKPSSQVARRAGK